MSFIKYCFLSLVLFNIAGCATTPLLPETLTHADLQRGKGILIGSIARGIAEWPYYNYGIFYRRVGETEVSLIEVTGNRVGYWSWRSNFSDDFNGADSSGSLFAYTLPAGRYEIFQYFLRYASGPDERILRATKNFSIEFTIQSGEIAYIGEFLVNAVMKKDLIGVPVPVDGIWSLRNQFDRDISLFTSTFPEINFTDAVQLRPYGCLDIYEC